MKVRVARRASRQIELIHERLLSQRPSAAGAFLDVFDKLRMRLDAYPRSAPIVRNPDLHQATVAGFPYVAIYRVTTRGVIILAVVHASRDPSVRTRP